MLRKMLIFGTVGMMLATVTFAFAPVAGQPSKSLQKFPNVLPYLPSDAVISNPSRDLLVADLDGDERKEIVVFYTLPGSNGDNQANVALLVPAKTGLTILWEDKFSPSTGFGYPTGVYDLNKSGKLQIVVYRVVGSSCPGQFSIFQLAGGKISDLSGSWKEENGKCQTVQIQDIDRNGVPELIIGKPKESGLLEIYKWFAGKYTIASSELPSFFDTALQKRLDWISTSLEIDITTRSKWSKEILQIYFLQKRYSQAVDFSIATIAALNDSDLTKPRKIPEDIDSEMKSRLEKFDKIERMKAIADIKFDLARAYSALGAISQSNTQKEEARKLIETAQLLENDFLSWGK